MTKLCISRVVFVSFETISFLNIEKNLKSISAVRNFDKKKSLILMQLEVCVSISLPHFCSFRSQLEINYIELYVYHLYALFIYNRKENELVILLYLGKFLNKKTNIFTFLFYSKILIKLSEYCVLYSN